MVFHMKTTLQINDHVMAQLRKEAARTRRTMSELVESALRVAFSERATSHTQLPVLPTFDGGGTLVDVSDRDGLFRAMEQG